MDLNKLAAEIQNHPRILDAGMVLIHLGQVRSFDLEGRPVISLEVEYDQAKVDAIRADLLQRPGIVEIRAHLNRGSLAPGEPIMVAAVAGETRDKVIPVLEELIQRLKKEASRKKEIK